MMLINGKICVHVKNIWSKNCHWSVMLVQSIGILGVLALNLTTLVERCLRGDLIEVFRIVNGFSDCNTNILILSRSRGNLVGKFSIKGKNDANQTLKSFFSNRVLNYWNCLPIEVKYSNLVNDFKINLENFKSQNLGIINENFYWDVTRVLLDRIKSSVYIENKMKQNDFLVKNPRVARKLFVNLN